MGKNSPNIDTYITFIKTSDGKYQKVYENRSVTMTIAVFVGGIFVGYIYPTVIDGIVISATGKSGAEWVSHAIDVVLNQPYERKLHLDCNIYPTYAPIYESYIEGN